ncbi:MAG: hypothetical protein GF330_10750 [Candidatus Eisenbacteria bacterium]|nr:hypothetical protein [Candidatus Eisenbacteria bacterium]
MSWTGRSSLLLAAVFAVAMTAVMPGVARAENLQGGTPLYYPSFPLEGGPQIIAATYHEDDAELRVVFNEEIDGGDVAIDDFVLVGFDANAAAISVASNRVVIIDDFVTTPEVGVDSVYIADIGLITDTLGSDGNAELSHVVITEGPVILYAEIANWDNDDPDDDVITAYFDDEVAIVSGDPFAETPEVAGADFDYTIGADNIQIELDATGGAVFRQMWPGISKLWMSEGSVEWADNSVANSVAQKRMLENEDGGPMLLGAYYNDTSEDLWLIFSEALNADSLKVPSTQYGLLGGSFGLSATQELAFPGSYTNCAIINDENLTAGDGDSVYVGALNPHYDYQTEPGPSGLSSPIREITNGVGMIRAEYDDGGTETLLDDRLEAWFNEPFNDLADVDSTDFHITDMTDSVFVYLTIQVTNEGNLGHVAWSGWHVADDSLEALDGRLPVGHRLYVDSASDIEGAETLTTVDTNARLPILEGFHPAPDLVSIPAWTEKYYGEDPFSPGDTVDVAYLAWRELDSRMSGIPDNSDEYFLFSTWTDPATFTQSFIETYVNNSIPIGNTGNGLLDDGVNRLGVSIAEGEFETSDGHVSEDEDSIFFMLVPCTYWGEMGDFEDALIFDESFVVGPVCPPQDFVAGQDDNLIHVTATYDDILEVWTYFVEGEGTNDNPNNVAAAPCGDSLFVFDNADPYDPGTTVLGVGIIDEYGGFGPIELSNGADSLETIHLAAWGFGTYSETIPIDNDVVTPTLLSINVDGHIDIDGDGDADGDLFDPYRIYKAEDYINILVQLDDQVGDPAAPTSALSDLLTATADFTAVDMAATYSGEDTDAIPLVSMGADGIDNDGDWDDTSGNGTLDGNGVMDRPEPFFDEDGSGTYEPGETFVDLDDDGLCDCPGGSDNDYDYHLDSADPDEHGWYEIQLDEDAYNDVTKGFQLLDPITDEFGMENFAEIFDLPVGMTVIDTDYEMTSLFEDDDAPFRCEVDEAEPSVVYMRGLYNLGGYTTVPDPADNLYSPTDPTYNLGRYMNFTIETPSDIDVLFGVAEIDPGTGTFEQFTLDPAGVNAETDAPGIEEFDDDRDGELDVTGTGQHNDGVDDDEDGVADNEGEGTDYQDAEVVDAMQDEDDDTDADGGDGIYITTDRRDNDNDAFFVFEPYVDLDAANPSDVLQRVVWYNIDESTDNSIDDDNDGDVDEADEVETYDPEADDNEDGIVDGEAVELTADAARTVCAFDDTYADAFFVDAAHVLGMVRDSEIDIRELTELVDPAWEVLDPNGVLTDAFPGIPFGDSTAYQEFDWHTIHGAENIDLWQIAMLYNLETDGSDQGYRFRVLGYDQPGNMNEDYSVPFTWTLDTTPPDLALEDCEGGDEDDPSLEGPPDFMDSDVDPDEDGVQLFNEGTYTLTTEDDDTAVEAEFEYRTSDDGGLTWDSWTSLATDPSRPFTADFDASTIDLDNDPANEYVLVQFRAYGKDEFENWQDPDEACVFQVKVIDGEPGSVWFTLIHDVCNDTDGLGGETRPCDLSDDEPYWYRDTYGPVQVPIGPAIDVWANFDDLDGIPESNDILRTVFEIRQAGEGNTWMEFATVTGEIIGDSLTVDFTKPVAVTLDTEWLVNEYGTGSFDIRVYVCDIEGNCGILTADIAMLTLVAEGLRAYIQEPVIDSGPLDFDLYAINWIHDYDIDYVTFEYFQDLNGNGLDDNDDRANGAQWYTIEVDDEATDRGDVVLYRGSDAIEDLAAHTGFTALGGAGGEGFIDYDGDGYSERDPVIRDETAPFGEYNIGDVIVLGDGDDIADAGVTDLTDFDADEFHTGDAGAFDTNDWIFQENGMQAGGSLDLWMVDWDATGLEGDILVRAVATDETGAVDDEGGVTIPSVIPTVLLTLDTVPPMATLLEFTVPDGTVIDATEPDIYVPGSWGWFKIEATSDDEDLDNILFQYSTDGGGTWDDLDVNDDDDFYADIDGDEGFTEDDEIFLDLDGSFTYTAGDVVLYDGGNFVVDTPLDTALIPLYTEDPAGGGDDDEDDMTDEDDNTSPEDDNAPYYVYWVWPTWASDTNVLFRALSEDQSGNVDPDPEDVLVIIGESTPPETDVIEVLTADGMDVDVWPMISDGDGVTQLPGGTVSVHATAEDASAIDYVDLMWQFSETCYPELEPWENQWRSMADDGVSAQDDTYPYNFDVDLDAVQGLFGDVVIAFYPNAVDDNGNQTPAPGNPYLFAIMSNFAYLDPELAGTTVAPEDEFWFEAMLDIDPTDPMADPVVSFYYAERVLDEEIDATRITPDPVDPTYMTLSLLNEMASSPENHATLTIDDSLATYVTDWDEIDTPTMYHWTWVDDAGDTGHVEFGALPDADSEIIVSYNVTEYAQIGDGDSFPPYTVAWDQDDGGVPYPTNGDTDAYDCIAVLGYGDPEDGDCGLEELFVSEGWMLYLTNEDAPEVVLYPFGLHNEVPVADEYPGPENYEAWPGNPSFDSEAGLTEWKMSGIEHEFFAVAADTLDEITEVNLIFTHGDDETVVPMTLIDENQENVMMVFTLYESDFPFIRYAWENVILTLNGFDYELSEVEDGVWQVADVPVPVGAETTYDFLIDMDGDDHDMRVVDPRNYTATAPPGPPTEYSSVNVPGTPFYYAQGIDFGELTDVWHVQVTAEDEDGNLGIDGPFTMVYDPEAPTVDAVTANSLRFDSDFDVEVYAEVTDPVPGDFNAITVDEVYFQYCPNYYETDQLGAHVWVDFGVDTDPSDGWWVTGNIPDPEDDGFDNDGDELWDEEDEATSSMAFRAIAMDDGHNYGEPMLLDFVLDETEPVAELTTPLDGEVFPFGTDIPVAADIIESEEDVAYVLFQFYVGDGVADDDGWVDIDITPEHADDHPFDAEPPYEVIFNPLDYPDEIDEGDTYCRFRAVPTDEATNEGWSEEVLVVINDITGPTAFPLTARTSDGTEDVPLTDPHCAVTGHDVLIKGIAVDPSGADNLATVTLQYWDATAEEWVTIEVVSTFTPVNVTTVAWEATWDTVHLPEGDYTLQAIATDIDGNTAEAITATVTVDHTAPSTFYEEIAGYFGGFAPYDYYDDDGVEESQGRALVPEEATGDLAFMVITPDTDVSGMVLEYRDVDDAPDAWNEFNFQNDDGTLDFEPNLTFDDGRGTYYVWWLHIDDFADTVPLSGDYDLRVVATDYAGNGNFLYLMEEPEANPWEMWTIDTDLPYQLDFNNDLTADQVASGDPVTVTCVMADSTTDVDVCRFEYSDDGGATWTVIDPDPDTPEIESVPVTGENVDTPYAAWTAQVTWIAPMVYWDTEYTVRAMFYDTAMNEGESDHMAITVEDIIAPEMTKLYAIAPNVHWVDMSPGDSAYTADCEGMDQDGLFYDHNGNDTFNLGTDLAIDYGLDGDWLNDDDVATGELGDPDYAWPRFIDETMIDNDLDLYVSHEVVLIGRTQIHDIGLRKVEFWVAPDGGDGDPILVDIDECPPEYGATYLWHVFWNTLDVDVYGDPIYPDGEYGVIVIAEDLEGNREELPTEFPTVWVDNEAPEATADADALTETVEDVYDPPAERNGAVQLFARTESERDDDRVLFYVKRARDLNMTESYWMPDEGIDDSDINPDWTRPFVFDWDLNAATLPDDPTTPPLPIGEEFHIVAVGQDFLGNVEDVTEVFDDGRYVTMEIVDNMGPVPTITQVTRETGDDTPVMYPHLMDAVHARDFNQLHAQLLDADTDAEKVEFMFMPEGGTEPTLIDADISQDVEDSYAWNCYSWDLSALAPGNYLVWARGWDDVGNYADGPQFTLVVDYTPPEYAVQTPYDGMKECPFEYAEGDSVYYELIFTTTDVDIWDDSIAWEVKRAQDPDDDDYWSAIDTDILFDADSGAYAGAWNVSDMITGLYDVRLTVWDVAGNEMQMIVAQNMIWDGARPTVDLTRIDVEGEMVYPVHDPVDISVGDVVTLYATAEDDEDALPDDFETGISSLVFEARRTTGDQTDWFDLGVWTAPEGTIFTEVTHSIDWNTSGLLEGTYEVRVWAADELCNELPSGAVPVGIFDIEPPRARICGVQPWHLPHGDDPESYVDIYGCAYCDTQIAEVQFQYSTDEGETWIPIGITYDVEADGGMDEEMCDLWYTTMSLDSLGVGAQMHLRAMAMDSDENQDENPPTWLVEVIENAHGYLELVSVEDLGAIDDPVLTVIGGSEDCSMLVEVQMADATQVPHVMWVEPDPIDDGGDPECIEMTQMIDDPTKWRGAFDMEDSDCGQFTVFANALSDGMIDLHWTHTWSYEVTDELGTNGVVMTPGYVADVPDTTYYLYGTAMVPPGSGGMSGCLLVAPAQMPMLNADEQTALSPLDRTSYHIGMICDYDAPGAGFWMTASIEYDDAALLAACDGDSALAAEKEMLLTVRRFDTYDDEAWTAKYIEQVTVDPENNKVTFVITDTDDYEENVYALFAPAWGGPVVVRSFTPDSPYAGRWNYTNRAPVIVADLNGEYGNPEDDYIDEESIEVWIDGNLVATESWVQGDGDGGDLDIEEKNEAETMYQIIYTHATEREWWLEEGWHTLNIRFKNHDGDHGDDWAWNELISSAPGARFYVDATPPTLEFWSGWTDNPVFDNQGAYEIEGYLNPTNDYDYLTAFVYDAGAGPVVCPTVVDEDDDDDLFGMKYDLWLVQQDEDDEREIDEIEDRMLLHTGTCDELFLDPPLVSSDPELAAYMPDDTLLVGLPTVGGGHGISDGDILEVVIYSEKHMEDWIEGFDCQTDIVYIDGDTLSVYVDCFFDLDNRVHVYDRGIMDWAGNYGSEYIEARFVVDMTPPSVELVTPAGGQVEPGEEFCFEVALDDGGAGVESASLMLVDADGTEIEITEYTLDDDGLSGCIEGGLATGNYSLVVEVADMTGNTATINVPLAVQSAVLAVDNAHLVPNPYNPNEYEASVCFDLSRNADVTIRVFDFAGEHVSTNHLGMRPAGVYEVPWNATTANGTALANGAYMIRIEAEDGSGTKAATVKAVVWRE